MKRMFFLLIFSIYVTNLHAQFLEQFTDGNFSSQPQWLGNTNSFVVNARGELQLNQPQPLANNTSYLVTKAPTSLNDSTTWEGFIRMEFATSTTNFSRLYLLANQSVLTESLNGYFLKIGGASGSLDALELYRQDGNNTTLLLAGTAGAVGGDSAVVRVRITRSKSGEWTLWADYEGGNNFQPEGSAVDRTYASGDYFGVYCRYTATRSSSFFFDDFRIDPLFADRMPPKLLSINILSATELELIFDENLDRARAENPNHFTIDNNIGSPTNAILIEPSKILLQLQNPLQNGVNYTMTVREMADTLGNVSAAQQQTFLFYTIQTAEPGDILITEIFADPTPTQGLPEAEFVELYNRSDKVIQLENFGFSAGGTPQRLPSFLLLPGAYVILCDDSEGADFQNFGAVLVVNSFPALTNSGDDLALTDSDGQVIFSISYLDDWYQNSEKAAGGWTLELIDFTKNPLCSGNWRASINPNGGTPGAPNSLLGTPADAMSPRLTGARLENDTTVLLTFSEALDANTAEHPTAYVLDQVEIKNAVLQTSDQVLLQLAEPLQTGQLYTIEVKNEVTDCLGNGVVTPNGWTIGIAESWQPGDVVINEVLFDPESGGSDFVELYNFSDKILNLNGLQILNATKTGTTASRTIHTEFWLLPQQYVAIAENPAYLRDRYNPPLYAVIFENDLPSLDDDSGNVTLRFNGATIDSLDYSADWHFSLLNSKEGISLERISPAAATQNAANWHSAASAVRFATPGYQNSQAPATPPTSEGLITLANATFSPDNDGFEDFLLLEYRSDQPGTTANIRVFDANGRLVKRLAENNLLAATGNFKWDGLMEDQSLARLGIYVVWIELFTPENGKVQRQKLTCVLAGKLD